MITDELLSKYNYDEFIPEKFMPWMQFPSSPMLGAAAPDFPLWNLDGSETSLKSTWSANKLTVVEFGSFT